jgi:hypothetical protein
MCHLYTPLTTALWYCISIYNLFLYYHCVIYIHHKFSPDGFSSSIPDALSKFLFLFLFLFPSLRPLRLLGVLCGFFLSHFCFCYRCRIPYRASHSNQLLLRFAANNRNSLIALYPCGDFVRGFVGATKVLFRGFESIFLICFSAFLPSCLPVFLPSSLSVTVSLSVFSPQAPESPEGSDFKQKK